jgi:hypothetical protein
MTEAEIEAVATTLGLILDGMAKRPDEPNSRLRSGVGAIGDVLAQAGGLALMSHVLDLVLNQRPEAESFREGVVDAAWSGLGGWAS